MIIISTYIAKHELKPLKKYFKIEDIIEGGRKILKDLSTEIRLPGVAHEFRFFKVRIGEKVKGRMIVFMVTKNMNIVPVLIRLKKDKKLGMNMAANNPDVVRQVIKNLDHILKNIEKKEYEEFDIE